MLIFYTASLSSSITQPAQPLLAPSAQIFIMDYGGIVGLAAMARKYSLFPDPSLEALLKVALFFPELEQDAADYISFKVLDRINSGYRAKF